MNFNKFLIIKFFISILIFSTTQLNAEVIFRLAELEDIAEFENIYTYDITHDDTTKLVIIPPRVAQDGSLDYTEQLQSINHAIANQHIYVAYDTETNCIVSFVKMYLDGSPNEMLHTEIRCLGKKRITEFSNTIAYSKAEIDSLPSFTRTNISQDFTYYPNKTIVIYYGCQYTRHAYRARGYNSQLCIFALKTIFLNKAAPYLYSQPILNIVYGQVNANRNNNSIIRCLGAALYAFYEEFNLSKPINLHVQHYGFTAYKPIITRTRDNNLEIELNNPSAQGIGNVLEHHFIIE